MTEAGVQSNELVPPAAESAAATRTRASGWASTTFESFGDDAYRTIWIGTIIAFVAFNMTNTAQSIVAYDLTGNNRAVGLVAFGQGIAMLMLPFGGAVADRFSRKLVLLIVQTVIGIAVLAIAVMLAMDVLTIGLLAGAAFIIGCMFAFLGPTRTAMVGDLVPEERLGNAIALLQVGGSVARITAPFLASMLVAWSVTGAAGAYFVIASLFIFVLATFYKIPAAPTRPKRDTSMFEDVRLGFSHVLANPRRLHLVISFQLLTILGMSFQVLIPGLSKEVLNAGTTGIGIMLGVSALGGLVLSLIVASVADSPRAPTYLLTIAVGTGVSLILLGLAPTFLLALGAMVLLGGCTAGFQTLNNAVAVRISDSDFYGRVIGLMFLAWGMMMLASLPIGYLADVYGERPVLVGLGISVCFADVLLMAWQRRIDAGSAPTVVDKLVS